MIEPRIIGGRIVFPACDITCGLPDAKVAYLGGAKYAALPHTVEAVQVLRNIGYRVNSPLAQHYTWPGQFTPYAHQKATSEFFTMNRRCFCTSGMGAMKTMAALWAADYLIQTGEIRRVLIVATLSTLERVWGDEIFRNFPHRSFAVLHGTRGKRQELLKQDHDFYVINHDGVGVIKDVLRRDIDLVIVDEVAEARNGSTRRWRHLKSIVKDRPWVWGLTGTPTPNAPTDAYAQMKLVCPNNYEGSFTRFKMETMLQLSQFKWAPRKGAEDTVAKILSPCIRYNLRDCVDLPETIYHEREAELSEQQKKHLKQLEMTCVTDFQDRQITAVNAAALIQKIVQISCGVAYCGEGERAVFDFGPRYNTLVEAIEEASSKVIIFVPFTAMLDNLADKLRKRWTVETVDGGVSSGKRNRIFSAFQDGKDPHILIANPGTMSHGLTLTNADTIIWYAPIWSGGVYPQANARIARPGQKLVTNIVHIFATATERRIYGALKEKGRLQDVVLSLLKNV